MSIAKFIGVVLGTVRALPCLVCYPVCRAVLGQSRAFTAASERIAAIPGLLGVYARQAFYRRVLGSVGGDVYFGYMSLFSKPAATLGDRVYIGRFCTIGWADIGDDAMLADGVQVLSGGRQHLPSSSAAGEGGGESGPPLSEPHLLRDNPIHFTPVKIGVGAWIGAGAIIMADVGDRAVVGAGAVVTRPVAAGERVGGVPAKPLG